MNSTPSQVIPQSRSPSPDSYTLYITLGFRISFVPTMAPPAKKIEQALLDGTYEVYSEAPDDTTVNKVRKHVEEKLSLKDGFFSTGNWKAKSKNLIKDRVVCFDQLHGYVLC